MAVAGIFLFVCIKLFLWLVQWAIDLSSGSNAKSEPVANKEEDSEQEEEDDNTVEPPDLDTKKGN